MWAEGKAEGWVRSSQTLIVDSLIIIGYSVFLQTYKFKIT